MTSTAARTGLLAAFALAVGLLATPPASAQSSAAPAPGAATACATSRPHSDTTLYAGISGGLGQLTIVNNYNQDAVIVLVRGKSKAISVYVRANAKAPVRNIKEGAYTIYYTTGTRFSLCLGRFTAGAAYYRFDKRVRFVPLPYYTIATFTLSAANGNEPATQIGPGDFPP